MTDQDLIKDKLRRFFNIQGKVLIDPSGVVNVYGNVRLVGMFPKLPVQFGTVTGFFICAEKNLMTLEGCPAFVGDNFDCSGNQITSLKHGPTEVTKSYRCSANQLNSLAHAPNKVGGYFNCSKNHLHNLVGGPQEVALDMSCHSNPLISLEGAPEKVGRDWWITWTEDLPLLKCLNASRINFMNLNFDTNRLENIMNPHMGSGKAGVIKCAAEMIRAGFKGNARW